jgi:hydrogenase nickel incorporation protein HypA/HybF
VASFLQGRALTAMHEVSIAMSLVEMTCEELAQTEGRVESLHVRIGRLSGIVPGALVSAFELASEGTPIEGAGILIEETPVRVVCPTCREERSIEGVTDFRCPACGASATEVVGGRELELVSLEISNVAADC